MDWSERADALSGCGSKWLVLVVKHLLALVAGKMALNDDTRNFGLRIASRLELGSRRFRGTARFVGIVVDIVGLIALTSVVRTAIIAASLISVALVALH